MRLIDYFRDYISMTSKAAGPLPVTEKQNEYLLVIVGICTKYMIPRALLNKQSDTVAKILVQVFGDYGYPRGKRPIPLRLTKYYYLHSPIL